MDNIGKKVYLVTNAHPKTLQVKMEKVRIEKWFERLVCSQEVGAAKEQPEFWQKLQTLLPYDKDQTFLPTIPKRSSTRPPLTALGI